MSISLLDSGGFAGSDGGDRPPPLEKWGEIFKGYFNKSFVTAACMTVALHFGMHYIIRVVVCAGACVCISFSLLFLVV